MDLTTWVWSGWVEVRMSSETGVWGFALAAWGRASSGERPSRCSRPWVVGLGVGTMGSGSRTRLVWVAAGLVVQQGEGASGGLQAALRGRRCGGGGVAWRDAARCASCRGCWMILGGCCPAASRGSTTARRVAGLSTVVLRVLGSSVAGQRVARGRVLRVLGSLVAGQRVARGRGPAPRGGHRGPKGRGPPGCWAAPPGGLVLAGGGSSSHHPGYIERAAAPRAWSSRTSCGRMALSGCRADHVSSCGSVQGYRGTWEEGSPRSLAWRSVW